MLGDLIDVVGGFTMTLGMDPLLMVQTSVMGRLHQLVAITLLFVGDGHILVIQGLSRSVQLDPDPSPRAGGHRPRAGRRTSAGCSSPPSRSPRR